jgi:hypothetical protein
LMPTLNERAAKWLKHDLGALCPAAQFHLKVIRLQCSMIHKVK